MGGFANPPITEDGIYIDEDFYIWAKGVEKEYIWSWFDKMHSKGLVKGLMNL